MIKEQIIHYKTRKKPETYIKYEEQEANHLTKRDKQRALYKYHICDYCGKEMKIENKWGKKEDITILPNTLTKVGSIKLALHNKCLKLTLKEFEE